MNTFRVLRTEAQKTVVTQWPFVALQLTASGWQCFGTGTAEECEAMVMRSARNITWTDIPNGAQATSK